MNKETINLEDKFSRFTDHWAPKVIAEMNDYQFKLVKVQGEFTWHSHPDTDEAFIVIDGELGIEFKDQTISLSSGEMYVVPRGTKHKPFADKECRIMLVEPKDVVNTGDSTSKLTTEQDVWI